MQQAVCVRRKKTRKQVQFCKSGAYKTRRKTHGYTFSWRFRRRWLLTINLFFELIADSHRRRKRQENIYYVFVCFPSFFVCATLTKSPVLSCFFFFGRTRPAASMRSPCLIFLSTCHEATPRERSDQGGFFPIDIKSFFRGRFLPSGQKSLVVSGCVQGAII